MRKSPFISILIPVLTFQFNCVSSQIRLEIKKTMAYPLSVEISGNVPNDYQCYVCKDENDPGKTFRDDRFSKGLFLAVTSIIGDYEKDFALRVKPVLGRFKEQFSINASDIAYYGSDVVWVAVLWERKDEKECCAAFRNGIPCEFCKKNGFHLQNQIVKQVMRD